MRNRLFALSGAVVLCLALLSIYGRMSNSAEIIVSTQTTGTPISPFLEGSNIVWQRQGGGMLTTTNKVVNRPKSFDHFAIEMAKNLRVPMLRFSGGQIYMWRNGVGPNRPSRVVDLHNRGIAQTSDVGTDEVVEFCRAVGAEPIFCLPYRATQVFADDYAPTSEQLSANWVEYCNGNSPGLDYGKSQGWKPTEWDGQDPNKYENKIPGSYLSTEKAPKGYFAWLREYFGHREPYKIKYWECGNEIYMFQPGRPPHSKAWAAADAYGAGFVRIAKAIKAVDPNVRIGVVADAGQTGTALDPWTKKLLGSRTTPTAAFKAADFIIVHQYIGPTDPGGKEYELLFSGAQEMERRLAAFSAEYPKPLIITEYNVQYGVFSHPNPANVVHQHRLKSALALAMVQNSFRRLKVEGACQFILMEVGAWWTTSEWRMIFEDIDPVTKRKRQGVTPTYQMLKLYRDFGQGRLLPVKMDVPENLDAVAVRDDQSGRIRLLVVNVSANKDTKAIIDLGGAPTEDSFTATTLNSDRGLEASNESGEQVKTISNKVENLSIRTPYTFPAHSLTALDLPSVK